ncbi:hypothetical protein BDW74DRAFT_146215 [Aspergillus multicolor]|uniref:uncharacterized protein n=1 Tax=Aspergillus multicolor TaxID=41759 RepID=UPI003CCDD8FB
MSCHLSLSLFIFLHLVLSWAFQSRPNQKLYVHQSKSLLVIQAYSLPRPTRRRHCKRAHCPRSRPLRSKSIIAERIIPPTLINRIPWTPQMTSPAIHFIPRIRENTTAVALCVIGKRQYCVTALCTLRPAQSDGLED